MTNANSIIEAMKSDQTIKIKRWGSKKVLTIDDTGKFLVDEPKGRGRHYHKLIHYHGDSESEAVKALLWTVG